MNTESLTEETCETIAAIVRANGFDRCTAQDVEDVALTGSTEPSVIGDEYDEQLTDRIQEELDKLDATFSPSVDTARRCDRNVQGEPSPDTRDVALKSYPLTRHLVVELDDSGIAGDRQDTVPSIRLFEDSRFMVHMTWSEARALAAALTEITDIAENG